MILENLLQTAKTKRKEEGEIKELKAPRQKGNSREDQGEDYSSRLRA